MGDFLKLILDSIQYLWPFEVVHQWERAVYYVGGRAWKDLGPGVYPKLPFFTSINQVSMVPQSQNTQAYSISVADGTMLTYAIIHEMECIDAMLALNEVELHEEKAHLDVLAECSRTLAGLPENKLAPEKRKEIAKLCLSRANKRLNEYGMRCNSIEFVVFAPGMRTYRLYGMTA